jgi:hypothetical protein
MKAPLNQQKTSPGFGGRQQQFDISKGPPKKLRIVSRVNGGDKLCPMGEKLLAGGPGFEPGSTESESAIWDKERLKLACC